MAGIRFMHDEQAGILPIVSVNVQTPIEAWINFYVVYLKRDSVFSRSRNLLRPPFM